MPKRFPNRKSRIGRWKRFKIRERIGTGGVGLFGIRNVFGTAVFGKIIGGIILKEGIVCRRTVGVRRPFVKTGRVCLRLIHAFLPQIKSDSEEQPDGIPDGRRQSENNDYELNRILNLSHLRFVFLTVIFDGFFKTFVQKQDDQKNDGDF